MLTSHAHLRQTSCLIVKTEGYSEEEVAKVVQLRATVEGLKLASGVVESLAKQGERSSLRYGPFHLRLRDFGTATRFSEVFFN